MFSNPTPIIHPRHRKLAWVLIVCGVLRLGVSGLPAAETAADESRVISPVVLTNFDQIWQAEPRQWHRVRFEYVVYHYDPLWMAVWGRCGDADSYISFGPKTFPIKEGQRILVEGLMQLARGMRIDEAKVTVLAETSPLEPVPTAGKVGSTELFNKRFVTLEGYVENQTVRDANHLSLYLIAEGRAVLAQILLKSDLSLPQLKGSFIKAKGVYFARTEADWVGPKIELWIQGPEDVEITGSIERDARFTLPLTSTDRLQEVPADTLVHLIATVKAQEVGKSVTVRDGAAEVVLLSGQTTPAVVGEKIEAIGFPSVEGNRRVVRQALYRLPQLVLTTVGQMWSLPDAERQVWHNVRFDVLVYHFDPAWKALWARSGDSGEYLSLGNKSFPIKPGQRILIEGSVHAASGMEVINPKVTILEEAKPLEAVSVRGRIGDFEHFNKRFVEVEGYVDRAISTDSRHLQVDLIVEGRLVTGRVMLPEGATIPNWEGALLRMKGVYSATPDPTGSIPTLEVWTPGVEYCEVLGSIEHDERFKIAQTPIEQLSSGTLSSELLPAGSPSAKLVRLVGAVRNQQPGKSLTLRDETGQVTVRTAMSKSMPVGQLVEAIGYPVLEGTQWFLRDGLFRRSQAAPAAPSTRLPTLRLADQLRELQPEEAVRSYPVHLTGVVTWTRPNADFFYVQDVSGGVRVYRPPEITGQLLLGTRVEVNGVSASGRFTPVVLAERVHGTSSMELPEPRPVTLEQALTGVEEARWVTMSGLVRAVTPDGPWSRFEVITSAGEFQAMVPPNPRWAKIAGSVVRMRGVCSALTNDRRQLNGIQLWVPSSRFVDVEEAAPENPFEVPTRSIASLRQFSSLEVMNRLVRVSGIVIHQTPGRLLHLQDGTEGLLVLSRGTEILEPGDRVETVGFPGRENNRVVLREAVFRKISSAAEPAALLVDPLTPFDAELDGRLVRVRALLLDIGSHEQGVRLINQQDQTIFEALLDAPRNTVPADWIPRSKVELTGVYQIQFDEYRRPHSVRIQLRTFRDVAILARPPWWTVKRALLATGLLTVGLVLGFGWVVGLRRRVRQQTAVIREQLESEKAARLEAALARASKLESLGVLAGGIAHDFNNLLTVVMGNLSLVKLDPKLDADSLHCITESERASARARDLTQQLLTFAKGGEPMRVSTHLPEIVREAAQFALHGSKARCDFEFAPDLWLANVDKGQIGQVVHNIVINANQAMPTGGLIQIVLSNDKLTKPRSGMAAGKYVKLSFSDTGTGISPENVARIFDPYFTTKQHGSGLGLASVYSIVKKHQGHVEVTSKLGQGTTFTIWLPAADGTAIAAGTEAVAKPLGSARVLFMDDEAPIRNLGASVLKRMGLDVTAVNDGAAVVSEYASATAAGRPYDLVIMDLTVPGGMGGGEAMEKLRAMDSNIRAIVSSGYSNDPVMANFRNHGFQARVPKPYLASDLIAAVNLTLGRNG